MLIEIKFGIEHTSPALDSIAKSLDRYVRHTTGFPKPPNPSTGLQFYLSGDSTMPTLFVSLPQVPADNPESDDVVSGELTLTIGGGESIIVATELGQTEYAVGELPAEDTVLVATFVFIDDAGLRSVNPLMAEYVVADTTPPPSAEEGLGFRVE